MCRRDNHYILIGVIFWKYNRTNERRMKMDTETMIRELERVEEKHKHDKVFTGQLDVAKMA